MNFINLKYVIGAILALVSLTAHAALPANKTSGDRYYQSNEANSREIMFIHGMFVTPICWTAWESYFALLGYSVSAPAWPLHKGSVEELRDSKHFAALGKLELADVVDYYRQILRARGTRPILIGHSMGGLIAQILLSEGLAQAAIAIDSAPPKDVIDLSWSFVRSNWGAINPVAPQSEPIELDLAAFSYAFLNAQYKSTQPAIYDAFYVPESRRIGKGPTQEIARIDNSKDRGPLLLIAGGEDHIIPASLNFKNFEKYQSTPAYTEFQLFEGRDHWTLAGPGWKQVAYFSAQWLEERFKRGRGLR